MAEAVLLHLGDQLPLLAVDDLERAEPRPQQAAGVGRGQVAAHGAVPRVAHHALGVRARIVPAAIAIERSSPANGRITRAAKFIRAMQTTYVAYGLELRSSFPLPGMTPSVAEMLPSLALGLATPEELDTAWSASDGPPRSWPSCDATCTSTCPTAPTWLASC
jgi:hypothetical protein